jgi:hypothetical protein
MAQGVGPGPEDSGTASNIGWIAGFIIIVAVLAVGGVLWFTYHPM